jgi:acyl carrier protein
MTENRLKQIFSDIFELEIEEIDSDTSTDNIDTWDSLHHMDLIVAIEDEFDVSFDEEDIPELQNYAEILEHLLKLVE